MLAQATCCSFHVLHVKATTYTFTSHIASSKRLLSKAKGSHLFSALFFVSVLVLFLGMPTDRRVTDRVVNAHKWRRILRPFSMSVRRSCHVTKSLFALFERRKERERESARLSADKKTMIKEIKLLLFRFRRCVDILGLDR